jgi:hypothetical protein
MRQDQKKSKAMARKKNSYICLGISLIPFLIAIFLYNRIINYPSTHLFAGNGVNPASIDRQMFLVLIFSSGIGFYFLSLIAIKYLPVISTKINIVYARYAINSILALSAVVLVLENLK